MTLADGNLGGGVGELAESLPIALFEAGALPARTLISLSLRACAGWAPDPPLVRPVGAKVPENLVQSSWVPLETARRRLALPNRLVGSRLLVLTPGFPLIVHLQSSG